MVGPEAPKENCITTYDRRHLAIYARLVSAHDAGADWAVTAREVLGLDVAADAAAARSCFQSHRDRALWIATEGFEQALVEAGLIQAH